MLSFYLYLLSGLALPLKGNPMQSLPAIQLELSSTRLEAAAH